MLVPISQKRKWKPHMVVIWLRLQYMELFLELGFLFHGTRDFATLPAFRLPPLHSL